MLTFLGYGIGVVFDYILKPVVYKNIIDTLSLGTPETVSWEMLLRLLLVLAGVSIVHYIGYRAGDYASVYFESKSMRDMYNESLERSLTHSHHFFSSNFSGSLIAKIKRYVSSFETLVDVVSYPVFFSLVSITGITWVLFRQSSALGLLFLGWSLVYVLITLGFIKKKMKLDILEADADSRVTAVLSDVITNMFTIKMFARSSNEKMSFEDVTNDEEGKRLRAWNFANMQNAVQAFLMFLLQMASVYISIKLWYEGSISPGTLLLVQAYTFSLFDTLWNLGRSITKAMKALTNMKEVVDVFDQKRDILDPSTPESPRISEGAIVIDNVSFSYPNGVVVFDDFTLHIPKGQKVGIVGYSGAGKTTITKLLLRFYDPTEGAIRIDGQDIADITQDDLRKNISYVPQEPLLFHRSIRDNIAYGKNNATEEDIVAAAKKAQAHEFIEKLPGRYETLVGERGVKLSGGERQRVAIARAMLKEAPVLVLDEATSSLDSASEKSIQEALKELMQGRTTIAIAHRLSTIQKMDRIIVLDGGVIIEDGTHAELLEKKGVYHELWSHQSAGFIAE